MQQRTLEVLAAQRGACVTPNPYQLPPDQMEAVDLQAVDLGAILDVKASCAAKAQEPSRIANGIPTAFCEILAVTYE